MSIAVTTVILFVVFGVLLFLGVPISVSICTDIRRKDSRKPCTG